MTLYLASRDLIVSEAQIDKLQGVLLVDPDYLQEKRVRHIKRYKQLLLFNICLEKILFLLQLLERMISSAIEPKNFSDS